MTALSAPLLRAVRLIGARLMDLEARVNAGDENAWSAYIEAAAALAAVVPLTTPEARGALLTTRELADRLQIHPQTLLRKAKKGGGAATDTARPARSGGAAVAGGGGAVNRDFFFSPVEHARAARGQLEDVLDFHGWPWIARLSLLIDYLVILEEQA